MDIDNAMNMKSSHFYEFQEADTSLELVMKRSIRTLMEVPTKDQIYDNVSFKFGAFYKRFWQNTTEGLKQNTRKAGDIIKMAESMQQISRQDDRLVKVCAYAREIKKFCADNYEDWKKYIWLDFTTQERKMMDDYVNELTPPRPFKEESKNDYEERQKARMFSAYGKMKTGMLLVEIFEKIWTIRMYRKNEKPQDVKRHQKIVGEMLKKIQSNNHHFQGYASSHLGSEEWKQIKQLW